MKVINFFGAPGVGKTTLTMLLTSMLKQNQIDAEPSLEFVKEYIHSNSEHLLSYQNYIFAQQERQLRIYSDSKEVEFVITDAPLLHSTFYEPENYPVFFKELVFEIFNSYDNINFFIHRDHPYSHQGRLHNEEKSDFLSKKMKAFLINHGIPFIEIKSTDNLEDKILSNLLKNQRVENYSLNKKIRD
jgi:nicotinamide riboside kinase